MEEVDDYDLMKRMRIGIGIRVRLGWRWPGVKNVGLAWHRWRLADPIWMGRFGLDNNFSGYHLHFLEL
jgi:hypothetical protein